MNRFVSLTSKFVLGAGVVARLAIGLMVLLVAGDVVCRYAFSLSPVALQELEWHLIAPIALLGMSYAMHYKADVRVDFIYARLLPKNQCIVDIIAGLLTMAVGFIVFYLSVPYVTQAFVTAEGSPDPGGLPYRWILKTFVPVGFALLGLQGISQIFEACIRRSQSVVLHELGKDAPSVREQIEAQAEAEKNDDEKAASGASVAAPATMNAGVQA